MITEEQPQRAEAGSRSPRPGRSPRRGGEREGPLLAPAVLRGVRRGMRVIDHEVFGPLVSIIPFDDLDEAVTAANATPFGLAAGLFTSIVVPGLNPVKMRFGSVHFNEAFSSRADAMPFGGVKDSGFGHEGPAYAIREMTDERLVTINP